MWVLIKFFLMNYFENEKIYEMEYWRVFVIWFLSYKNIVMRMLLNDDLKIYYLLLFIKYLKNNKYKYYV